ncbi:heavy-metal-associated domain-containing protein [Alicyclobacillus dauci]|uniref:Copper chaperone CopZ n=1 Tax=Alicyclobacillus dauci TaxID=1475485 RepID=A0ABY6Z4D9_9BACL|nr:copper ion binding protein [Alicyclobacillus dauci]WAH37629.1 copper ion binding protein [Alicyclobacillus dauci]
MMTTTHIAIQGMSCSGCVNAVTNALESVDGVQKVDVSLDKNEAQVIYDEHVVTLDALRSAVEDAGYDVGA